MENKPKAPIVTIIAVVILIIVAVGAYNAGKNIQQNGQGTQSPAPTPTETLTPTASPVSTTQTYSNAALSFEYPSVLTVSEQSDGVKISHGIAFPHPAPCDFKGDGGTVPQIVDFDVSMKVVNQSAKDYVTKNNWPDWKYVSDNPYSSSTWKGYHVISGVEGCGQEIYYLTVSPTKTLIVTRALSDELNNISATAQKYLSLPGIIPPTKATEYLSQIIESVRVK